MRLMRLIRIKVLILVTFFGLAALFILLQYLGRAPAALAREEALSVPVDVSIDKQQANRPEIDLIDWRPVFTDFLDLSGNLLGTGVYDEKLKCNGDNCS